MGKIFPEFSICPNWTKGVEKGDYIISDKYKLQRVSRWITIQRNYNPCPRNSLWDYVEDENGYKPYNDKFNPENGLYLDYFVFRGRKWAVEQFLAFGSGAYFGQYYGYIDESNTYHYLSGIDGENYFNPIFIELDEYGEKVRIYEEVENND